MPSTRTARSGAPSSCRFGLPVMASVRHSKRSEPVRILLRIVLVLTCMSSVAQAQTYKCTEPGGRKYYQDAACPPDAVSEKLTNQPISPNTSARNRNSATAQAAPAKPYGQTSETASPRAELRFNSLRRPLVAASLFEECRGVETPLNQIDERTLELRKSCLTQKRLSGQLPKACDTVDTSGPPLAHHNDERFLVPNCAATHAHVVYLENRLRDLCTGAGETISKTADDTESVSIGPLDKERLGPLHEREGEPFTYRDLKTGRRLNITKDGSSKYGIRIEPLLSKTDNRQGLYGSRLTIFDTRTNEKLADRTLYYFIVTSHLTRSDGKRLYLPRPTPMGTPYYVATCLNYPLQADTGYMDGIPRHSFEFVSRVLRPRM